MEREEEQRTNKRPLPPSTASSKWVLLLLLLFFLSSTRLTMIVRDIFVVSSVLDSCGAFDVPTCLFPSGV